MVRGECYVHAFGFHSILCQQVHQLTHALLELLLRVWIVWHLCLGFPWISIKTRTQAPAWLMVFCVVGPIVPSLHQLLPSKLAGQLGSAGLFLLLRCCSRRRVMTHHLALTENRMGNLQMCAWCHSILPNHFSPRATASQ